MKNIKINSLEEMKDFGVKLGKLLKGSETICLYGNLGAGKTHLTKFIGEGMGIEDYITSPTFSILNIYEGKINLNHFDIYRLDGDVEFEELGFDEYLFSDDVNIIEWPEIIKEYLPKSIIEIHIEKPTEDTRELIITTTDNKKYKYIMENI